MKKSNGHIALAIIGLVIVLFITCFFGYKLPSEIKAETALTESFQLVYQVESEDPTIIKQTADILVKRLYNFGCSDVKATVDGNKVSLIYNGTVDNTVIRANLTRKGEVSYRNSSDQLLGSTNMLDPQMPLACQKAETGTYIYFYVASDTGLTALTTSMLLSTDKMLVIWVDYNETQKYATESTKTTPAYFAAANVSSVISDDFYITSSQDYEVVSNTVNVVNGGTLPVEIKEVGFDTIASTYGENAISKILVGVYASIGIISVYLIFANKLVGIVNSVMLFAYTIVSLISLTYLNVIFTFNTIVYLFMNMFVICVLLTITKRRFVKEMSSGRNSKSSFTLATKGISLAMIEGFAVQFVFGFVAYLLNKELIGEFGLVNMVFAVTGAIFMVVWNNKMVSDLLESNSFDKTLFGYKETYEPKLVNVSKALSNKIVYYIIVVCGLVGAVVYANTVSKTANTTNLLTALLTIAIGLIIVIIYQLLRNKKYNVIVFTSAIIVTVLLGCSTLLVGFTGSNFAGMIICLVGSMIVLVWVVIYEINLGYKELAKGKLSGSIITDYCNNAVDQTFNDSITNFIVVVVCGCISLVAIIFSKQSILLVLSLLVIYIVTVMAQNIAFKYLTTKSDKPKAKKKTRVNNELTEATVFGINEIRK